MFPRSKVLWAVLIASVIASFATCRPRDSQSSVKEDPVKTVDLFRPGSRVADQTSGDQYYSEIQPTLSKRCSVCHGCTSAPCSLKTTSHTGVMRGGSKLNPYSVHVKAVTFPEMRVGAPDFHPVIADSAKDSIMFKFIAKGAANTTDADPEGAFSLNSTAALRAVSNKKSTYNCPATPSEFDKFISENPGAGMPFGLPRLADSEHKTLMEWIALNGGKGPSPQAVNKLMRPSSQPTIHAWEMFLNFHSDRKRMAHVAKYFYEHTFNSHIYFDEMPGEFFKIVRTKSAPPQGDPNEFRAIDDEIVTELPTDAPGVQTVFYRFKKVDETITQKNHVPFHLNREMIESYKNLFFDASIPWNVSNAPEYGDGNVFSNFKAIPEVIRHRFMLENARYIVDSMVRAPVCVGPSATFAIPDHFWVYFLRPEMDPSSGGSSKMSAAGFNGLDLTVRTTLAVNQVEERFKNNYVYLEEYERALRQNLSAKGRNGLALEDIWYGESLRNGGVSKNRNAWLSVTRHDNSTTVQLGHEGGAPQTMWVLTYANFERLYYNLVVNFKYWGSIKHKLGTWRSMSHERLDGEDMYLSWLPVGSRIAIRNEWSGGLEIEPENAYLGPIIRKLVRWTTGIDNGNNDIKRYIDLYPLQSLGGNDSAIRLTDVKFNNEKLRDDFELAQKIRDKMLAAGVIKGTDELNANEEGESIYEPGAKPEIVEFPASLSFEEFEKGLARINVGRAKHRFAAFIPATTIARVTDSSGNVRVYTFIGNRGYKSHNISVLATNSTEGPLRDITRDTTSIYRGAIGDFPQMFLDINLSNGGTFLNLLNTMNQQNYFQKLVTIGSKFAITRNSSKFWPFVDWLHQYIGNNPSNLGPGYIYAGILDLNAYQ